MVLLDVFSSTTLDRGEAEAASIESRLWYGCKGKYGTEAGLTLGTAWAKMPASATDQRLGTRLRMRKAAFRHPGDVGALVKQELPRAPRDHYAAIASPCVGGLPVT